MKKALIIGGAVGLIIAIIMNGFDKHQTTIESYSTEFSTYVLAKYSETNVGVDFEGHTYIETDYWDEQVSATWFVSTVKDSIIEYNCPTDLIEGYTCRTPEITIQHRKGSHFNRYDKVRSIKYYVDYGDGDFSTADKEEYEAARLKLGEYVTVKTWYGGAYGFDLNEVN